MARGRDAHHRAAYLRELEDCCARSLVALTLVQHLRADVAPLAREDIRISEIARALDTIIRAFQGEK
jgi:hypothetical protein